MLEMKGFTFWAVVVLPDPFWGPGAWRNYTETNGKLMP